MKIDSCILILDGIPFTKLLLYGDMATKQRQYNIISVKFIPSNKHLIDN